MGKSTMVDFTLDIRAEYFFGQKTLAGGDNVNKNRYFVFSSSKSLLIMLLYFVALSCLVSASRCRNLSKPLGVGASYRIGI